MPSSCGGSVPSSKGSLAHHRNGRRGVSGKACGWLRRMADSRERENLGASADSSKCIYFQSLPEFVARPNWHMKCTLPLLSNSREEPMQLSKFGNAFAVAAILAMTQSSGIPSFAQETAQEPERQAPVRAP